MFKNYFKTACRNLSKHPLFSVVNIAGLSMGIAGTLLIGLYIFNELNYDHFHKNAQRIVRVETEYTLNGTKSNLATSGSMVGPRLASVFPEIESFVRMISFQPYSVQFEQNTFVERKFLFADSSFFNVFSFPLLEGNARTALDGPEKVVITRSMEKKYFGNQSALGKSLLVGGNTNYLVTGVTADLPENSQIKFDFVASLSTFVSNSTLNWWVEIYNTYFLLRPGADPVVMEKNIAGYMHKQPDLGLTGRDYLIFHLDPITRVHLYSRLSGLEPNSNITYIYILAAIAMLILVIACVNYTNLTTAQAAGRTPEISIRKVLGSGRMQLFWQFIGESLLLNFICLIIAVLLVIILLPTFNTLVERSLSAETLIHPLSVSLILLLYCTISLSAGIYPALIVSGMKLIHILKSKSSFTGGTGPLRKSLIVFQFFASIFLIISTVIIFEQMSFVKNKDLGYDKSHVLVFPVDGIMRSHFQQLKETFALVPGVQSVSCGAEEPTFIRWDDEITFSADPLATPTFTYASPADPDFGRTLGLHIIAGTDFTHADWLQLDGTANRNPQTAYMLNETLAKSLGWLPGQAIGKTIYRSFHKGVVRAVVKDFNFAPLHEPIAPLVIFLDSQYSHIYQAYVKISGNDVSSTVAALETTWKQRVTHRPFQYHFLDDNFNTLYHTESQTAKIFSVFSVLAILLACLGLFALSAYITVQRSKEIGIRKVLGAGAFRLIMLISGDFLKLVALSMLLAFPLAWVFLSHWLSNFAYRINISWIAFLLSGIAASVIAFISIGFQAYKTAMSDPVKSLRND